MNTIPDHYAALGIDPTADQEVIAAAYRALAKKYHPDTGATTGTASAERFATIQQAYEVLGSAEGRQRYDMELLEATQRELDAHLARKQRKIAGTTAAPPPAPDLGVIRPERHSVDVPTWNLAASLREMGPFLVVSGLLMAVAGGIAGMFLLQAPLPAVENALRTQPPLAAAGDVTRTESPQSPPQAEASLPPRPEPQPLPPQPPEQQAALPQEEPLFGTSLTDEPATPVLPPPAEAQAIESAPAAAAVATAPPVPKARPQTEGAVRLPAEIQASARRFTVVIYEKYRSADIIEEEGGVVFSSESRCADFGERAVLRRLAPYEGERQRQRPRIWYECLETH